LPQPVRLSLPDWLYDTLLEQARDASPDAPHAALERLGRALLEPAALDLRVNLLKSDRDALRLALAADGIVAEPLAASPTALRVRGKPALERSTAFERGDFEVQDLGSQRLVAFAAPKRGATVVDFCAGAGGKTLAMAAAMRSSGQVFACDVSNARLARLKPRLARSGATSVQPFGLDSEHDPKLGRLAGPADLVLVDAPCSGTGTLRRNPGDQVAHPAGGDRLAGRHAGVDPGGRARLVKAGRRARLRDLQPRAARERRGGRRVRRRASGLPGGRDPAYSPRYRWLRWLLRRALDPPRLEAVADGHR
jgi:16S rRNA (cytosine967-C5)-methyltransferase